MKGGEHMATATVSAKDMKRTIRPRWSGGDRQLYRHPGKGKYSYEQMARLVKASSIAARRAAGETDADIFQD